MAISTSEKIAWSVVAAFAGVVFALVIGVANHISDSHDVMNARINSLEDERIAPLEKLQSDIRRRVKVLEATVDDMKPEPKQQTW